MKVMKCVKFKWCKFFLHKIMLFTYRFAYLMHLSSGEGALLRVWRGLHVTETSKLLVGQMMK